MKHSKVEVRYDPRGVEDNREDWEALQKDLVDGMVRLEKALRPHLDKIIQER